MQPMGGISDGSVGTVSVLGTGDYGSALAKRLLESGFRVVVGSRNPKRRDLSKRHATLEQASVLSVQECVSASNVIIIAIPCDSYGSLAEFSVLLEGKILVDVSNPKKISKDPSNAERLAELLPKSRVVKCFNTISAYALTSATSDEHPQAYVASNDDAAVDVVRQLAQAMGFPTTSAGRLEKARDLEARSLHLFPGWGWPTLFTAGLFVMELLYLFLAMYILVDRYAISQIPTYLLYKACGAMSINLLAFCYLPGIFAAFAQLYYGSKHTRFQKWLDCWLQGRKQLGIYSLMFGFMHMITVMSCMNGAYFSYLFVKQKVTVPVNMTTDLVIGVDTKMNLHGEGCIASGIIALVAMGILGLTSLPPVGALLNWREWRFIQSQFGFVCFLLSVGHCMVHGVPRWMIQRDLPLRNSFMSLILPWFTLLLKIIYFIPCVNSRVWKIRRGYDRGMKYDTEQPKPRNVEEVGESRSSEKYVYANDAFSPDVNTDHRNVLNPLAYDGTSTPTGSSHEDSGLSSNSISSSSTATDLSDMPNTPASGIVLQSTVM